METKELKLKPEHTKLLSRLPEQGMGYQIVDLILKDGCIIAKRLVFNSTYLNLKGIEGLNQGDIVAIRLSD